MGLVDDCQFLQIRSVYTLWNTSRYVDCIAPIFRYVDYIAPIFILSPAGFSYHVHCSNFLFFHCRLELSCPCLVDARVTKVIHIFLFAPTLSFLLSYFSCVDFFFNRVISL